MNPATKKIHELLATADLYLAAVQFLADHLRNAVPDPTARDALATTFVEELQAAQTMIEARATLDQVALDAAGTAAEHAIEIVSGALKT